MEKEDGEINPYTDTLESIYRKYRAFYLRPKIYFFHEGKRIVVEQLDLDENLYTENQNKPLLSKENLLLNKCVKTILIKPEGKKSMDRDSFKNGYLK
ncbi:TPA: hypothetical protein DEP21_01700 [Patescibacteria group bacterium]|nr:hypothetical protein [Candidatus Gracilibacteria bacterium]